MVRWVWGFFLPLSPHSQKDHIKRKIARFERECSFTCIDQKTYVMCGEVQKSSEKPCLTFIASVSSLKAMRTFSVYCAWEDWTVPNRNKSVKDQIWGKKKSCLLAVQYQFLLLYFLKRGCGGIWVFNDCRQSTTAFLLLIPQFSKQTTTQKLLGISPLRPSYLSIQKVGCVVEFLTLISTMTMFHLIQKEKKKKEIHSVMNIIHYFLTVKLFSQLCISFPSLEPHVSALQEALELAHSTALQPLLCHQHRGIAHLGQLWKKSTIT